jgi:hypothetical protein
MRPYKVKVVLRRKNGFPMQFIPHLCREGMMLRGGFPDSVFA